MFKKFFKKNNTLEKSINNFKNKDFTKVPKHVAIIMDGNGRWAKEKKLPRINGHYEGMKRVEKIAVYASKIGIEYLTLYAFSTENWNRPKEEVKFLMSLPEKMFNFFLPSLMKENIQINTIGDISSLPEHTRKVVNNAVYETRNNTGLKLIFALNYGARTEILNAVKKVAIDYKNSVIKLDNINNSIFSNYLETRSYPDPDLLIRTSGGQRISNFLLWQIAYSEFVFSKVYWPDFSEEEFNNSLVQFQNRDRRYGGLNEN